MIEAICATIFALVVLVTLIRFYQAKGIGSGMIMGILFVVALAWALLAWEQVIASY